MMKTKIEGHQNLYKDEETGVIVNRSTSDRDRYRIAKKQSLSNMNTDDEIKYLKDELSEIKTLLRQLINK